MTTFSENDPFAKSVDRFMTPNTKSNEEIEILSEQIHQLYCKQYLLDHGEPYWTNGDYSKLEDRVKEYDRNIARWHLKALTLKDQAHKAEVEELKKTFAAIFNDLMSEPTHSIGRKLAEYRDILLLTTPLPESDKSN